MRDFLLHGLGAQDLALTLNRVILGAFFVLARFRWFYDPSRPGQCWFNCGRRETLVKRLCTCGYVDHQYLAAAVATTEVLGGALLVLGFLSIPAALGIFVVMCFATYCTAVESVVEQHPLDKIDCVCRYLYTVEPLYLLMAFVVLLAGPGAYSLDAIIWSILQ